MFLKGFNIKIYRLREENAENEFILYDLNTKKWNQYNKTRITSILLKEIINTGIDFLEQARVMTGNMNLTQQELTSKLKNQIISLMVEDEYILIDNIGYKPVECEIYEEEEYTYFNTYKKSKYLSSGGKKGNFKNIKALLMNLCGDNEEQYNYFNSWLGYIIQNPLTKLKTSIVFKGQQSSGKSKFSQLVLKNIFGSNYETINQKALESEFNYYMMGTQLIVAEEVIHNENKMTTSEKLKDSVSNEWATIRRLYKNTLLLRNYTHWIFFSNNHIPLKLDPDDTRYSIFFSKKLENGLNLINNLRKNLENELNAYVYYLLNLKVDFAKINVPFQNEERQKVIKAAFNNVQEFLSYSEDLGGFINLNELYKNNNMDYYDNQIKPKLDGKNKTYIETNNMYYLYKHFCIEAGHKPFSRANFTREMNKFGYDNGVQRIEGVATRVIWLN